MLSGRDFSRLTPGIRVAIIGLHILWPTLLFISADPLGVTPIYNVYTSSVGGENRYLTAVVFIVAAMSAIWSFRFTNHDARGLLLLGPQGFVMALSASGALEAILNSQYADHEPRPWAFIAADQAIWIVLFAIHGWLLITLYWIGNSDAKT